MPDQPWSWLALMQHDAIPTRVTGVTYSPCVALFRKRNNWAFTTSRVVTPNGASRSVSRFSSPRGNLAARPSRRTQASNLMRSRF